MAPTKRADIIKRTHKMLARHYKPVNPTERSVFEQLLYAVCLEDSRFEAADECFARLQESYYDWNEVRVTTVRELSEIMRGLHDPVRAATLVKQTLHSVFEAIYNFDLEAARKQNLGVTIKQLGHYRGTTPFSVSYVVQNCLGGHSIPVSEKGLVIMYALGIIDEKERNSQSVPGLERAISKNKGIEFGSILQQLAADFAASPFNSNVRALLLEIQPDAKERLPKRSGRKSSPRNTTKKKSVKTAVKKALTKVVQKKTTVKKKAAKKKAAKKKASAAKPMTKKKTVKDTRSIAKKATRGGKKSASKQLARRKPR